MKVSRLTPSLSNTTLQTKQRDNDTVLFNQVTIETKQPLIRGVPYESNLSEIHMKFFEDWFIFETNQ